VPANGPPRSHAPQRDRRIGAHSRGAETRNPDPGLSKSEWELRERVPAELDDLASNQQCGLGTARFMGLYRVPSSAWTTCRKPTSCSGVSRVMSSQRSLLAGFAANVYRHHQRTPHVIRFPPVDYPGLGLYLPPRPRSDARQPLPGAEMRRGVINFFDSSHSVVYIWAVQRTCNNQPTNSTVPFSALTRRRGSGWSRSNRCQCGWRGPPVCAPCRVLGRASSCIGRSSHRPAGSRTERGL
jgi:hypothetical protein